jgi:hypothetical protein
MMAGTRVQSSTSRCVLWHAPGTAPPADLVQSLERRGVELTACTTPYSAIARACLRERENDERTDDPSQRDSLVLVLVTPLRLEQPAEVVDAMRRYAPRTACWWYDPSANPRLRAVVDEDVDQWLAAGVRSGQPAVIRPRGAEEPRPRLKLATDPDAPGSGPVISRVEGNSGGAPEAPHTRMDGLRGVGGG